MARSYRLIVSSNYADAREYIVSGVDILNHAQQYGRAEGGETVTLYGLRGKPVARAVWSAEARDYVKVAPPEDSLQPRLTVLRERRGMSLEELSSASGVSEATIKFVAGGRNTTMATLSALAKALDCRIEDIIDA